jgi:hypothetical protein
MMASFKPYTPEEVDILTKMVNAGCTPEQCAKVLKSRTVTGIEDKAGRLGMKWKYLNPEIDMDEFKRLMKGK